MAVPAPKGLRARSPARPLRRIPQAVETRRAALFRGAPPFADAPAFSARTDPDLVEARLELAPRRLAHRRRVHRLEHDHEVVEVLVTGSGHCTGLGPHAARARCATRVRQLVPAQPPRARVRAGAAERDRARRAAGIAAVLR